jgi:hypothetical protein
MTRSARRKAGRLAWSAIWGRHHGNSLQDSPGATVQNTRESAQQLCGAAPKTPKCWVEEDRTLQAVQTFAGGFLSAAKRAQWMNGERMALVSCGSTCCLLITIAIFNSLLLLWCSFRFYGRSYFNIQSIPWYVYHIWYYYGEYTVPFGTCMAIPWYTYTMVRTMVHACVPRTYQYVPYGTVYLARYLKCYVTTYVRTRVPGTSGMAYVYVPWYSSTTGTMVRTRVRTRVPYQWYHWYGTLASTNGTYYHGSTHVPWYGNTYARTFWDNVIFVQRPLASYHMVVSPLHLGACISSRFWDNVYLYTCTVPFSNRKVVT